MERRDEIVLLTGCLLMSGRFEPERCASIALRVSNDIEELCREPEPEPGRDPDTVDWVDND